MYTVQLHLQWRAATVEENGQGYAYPARFSDFFRKRYSVPAVYRWRIHPGEGGKREQVYIGEAEVLVRRVQQVRTPPRKGKGGETNKHLRKIFDEEIANGKFVFLDILDFDPFELNGMLFSARELGDRFKRRLLENLCICTAQASNHTVLNSVLEPVDKIKEKLSKLPPAELRRLLREAEANP